MTFTTITDTPSAIGVIHYPGGEVSPVLPDDLPVGGRQLGCLQGGSSDDLITALLWAHDVHRLGGRPSLLVPYLPAARADHADRPVGYDAEVYAELLNSARFERIVCIDPHSPVMPSMVERISVISAADLIDAHLPASLRERLVGLIVPDEGARDRVRRVADRLGLPTFQAHKHRDFATGKLSGFTCDPLPEAGDLLVVDDICDGGGTFMGLAGAVPEAAGRLHLWVSHGVFSGRAAQLLDAYETITTTDSHPGCTNIAGVAVIPVGSAMRHQLALDLGQPPDQPLDQPLDQSGAAS